MSKFKVGDRVICIASGEEYIIKSIPVYKFDTSDTLSTINNMYRRAFSKDYVCIEPKDWDLFFPPAFYEHEIKSANSILIKKRLGIK